MSKNQSKQEVEENDPWLGEDSSELVEPATDVAASPRSKLETRHKIEDLIEQRRLKKLLGDYDSFEIDDDKPRRMH